MPISEPHACGLMREALRTAGVELFRLPTPGVRLVARSQKRTGTRDRARPRYGVLVVHGSKADPPETQISYAKKSARARHGVLA